MSDGSRGGGFREQYDRMLRWFQRFQRITSGVEFTDNVDYHEDTMRAFFENCFHLRDWIINDPKSGIPEAVVRNFVNTSPSVALGADLANTYKHMVLTQPPKTAEDPSVGPRDFTLALGGSPPYGQVRYTIKTKSGQIDAFDLAVKCVEDWKTFLTRHGHAI